MAITLSLKREWEFTGNDSNGDPCLFPRLISSPTFVEACNLRTGTLSEISGKYDAFPDQVYVGSSIICLFSRGAAHAQSDSQIMVRSDDGGITWSSVIFVQDSAPTTFNTNLLQGLLLPGESVVLKTYTIKNVSGVLTVYITSTVTYNGDVFALWSPARKSGSTLYRSGYGNSKAALFESADSGQTWNFKSMVFSEVGKQYSEFDIVNIGGSNWMAVCREDSGASNPLYMSKSSDNMATWSVPSLIPTTSINGRQPNLMGLSDGSVVLAVGDRTGVTGAAGAGEILFGADTTGIVLVKTSDYGVTWGYRTNIGAVYSTDGGQPRMINLGSDRIFCTYYSAITVKEDTRVKYTALDPVIL